MSTLPSNVTVNLTSGTHPKQETCNAAIHGVTCVAHDRLAELPHGNPTAGMRWDDLAPGAKPHTPPRYRAEFDWTGSPVSWRVEGHNGTVTSYYMSHPDAEAAAKAEASRLSGEDDRHIVHDAADCLEADLRRERDDARAERDKAERYCARYHVDETVHERTLLQERGKLAEADATADAFRAALEQIVEESCSDECTEQSHNVLLIAREALEGVR